jgi:putative nucleotidyltransferase with HDIG domain
MNAIALGVADLLGDDEVKSSAHEVSVRLVDPFHGLDAIESKTIVAVGRAHDRFNEDALRMMRAIRFGAQLGFSIETSTLQAIKDNNHLIKNISFERIRGELLKILASQYPADGIMLLLSSGMLEHIVPEMVASQEVIQGGRHKFDVWTHSLESLKECPSTDVIVRLATWLHDVGKPATQRFEGPRGVTFYGHEVVGARIARNIAQRLRLPKKDVDRIFILVRWHMFTYSPEMTDAAVRRFIKRVGRDNINDMMMLRIGDRKGGGSNATSWRLRELQQRIGENLYEPMSLKDLAINGTDLMEALQLPPGKKVGEILNALFEEVIEEPQRNNAVYLLERARELK